MPSKKDQITRWLNNRNPPPKSSYQDDYKSKSDEYVREKEHQANLNVTRETAKSITKIGTSVLTLSPKPITNSEVEKNQNKRDAARSIIQERDLTPIPVNGLQRFGSVVSGGVRSIPGGKTASKKYMEWTREAIEREDQDGIQRIGYTD